MKVRTNKKNIRIANFLFGLIKDIYLLSKGNFNSNFDFEQIYLSDIKTSFVFHCKTAIRTCRCGIFL
jgi:hypothetical protein